MKVSELSGGLPCPLKITFFRDGTARSERTTWAEYHRLNPRVQWRRDEQGRLVSEPVTEPKD